MGKKVIIIGAGVSGLACGVYLAKSGCDVQIFEKNDKCGGLCTTTARGNYLFESCLYWVFGTNPENSLHRIWEELGVTSACQFIQFEEYMRLEYEHGDSIRIFSDLTMLSDELKAVSLKDSKKINRLYLDAKKVTKFNLPYEKPPNLWNLKDLFAFLKKVMPYLPLLFRYKNMSIEDYVKTLKSEKLRGIFLDLLSIVPNYPMLMVLLIFASMDSGNANYPKGGSLFLAEAIRDKLLSVANKNVIRYGASIHRILTEKNKAIGVELKNGEKHYADYVISCSDGYTTIFNMLDGKYGSRKLKRRYKELPVFHSYMQISFGVDRDLSKEQQFIVYKFESPIIMGNRKIDNIRIRHYNFNEHFAPKGKSSLVVTFDSDFDYWDELYSLDADKYNAEKQRVKDEILNVLGKRFAGIESQIEMTDIATPKTFERYSGNRKGSAEGWGVTCKTLTTSLPYNLKGLENFYMAGHWTNINGGILTAAITARQVVQLICHRDNVQFRGNCIL